MVQLLIKDSAEVNLIDQWGIRRYFMRLVWGRLEFLNNSSNNASARVNHPNGSMCYPLGWAGVHGHINVIYLLKKHGDKGRG